MTNGLFIALEGCDYSGKSSHLQDVVNFFEKKKLIVHTFRETDYYKSLGEWKWKCSPTPAYQLFLFSAIRVYLVENFIKPLLNDGHVVVLDRYVLSTTIYQGLDLSETLIEDINYVATDGIYPDCYLIFNAGEAETKRRALELGPRDKLDEQFFTRLEKIRKQYVDFDSIYSDCYLVDSSSSFEETTANINRALTKFYNMYVL